MALTEKLYIESSTSLEEKLTRYNQIIDALETQMLNVAADNSDVMSYSIDDGQVKIQTQYRDVLSIANAIDKFQMLRNKILNKLNGRSVVLRDWRGLN